MYLSQIGLFLAVIWYGGDLLSRTRRRKLISIGLITIVLASCALLTIRQIPVWKNSQSMWQQAYRLDANNSLATYHLAEFLLNDGNKPEAIRLTRNAIQNEDRSDCETLVMLGMLMADCGEYEDCVNALDKALAEHPDDADVLSNRAKALSAQGKWKEAADDYRRSAQISPGSPSYQFYLAHALGKIGQTEESRQIYASAVKRWPQWPLKVASRAWWMSTSPNPGDRANFWPVCLAEQACEATGGNLPQFLDALAAAYAESGRFEEAIETVRRAIQQADHVKNSAYSKVLRERLELYENNQPYRDRAPAPNNP
jgi:tetratricopeptide (TPR) repeat protein